MLSLSASTSAPRLRSIDADGALHMETSTPSEQTKQRIERLWREQPFVKLSADALARSSDDEAVKPVDDETTSTMMTSEDLIKLKTDTIGHLSVARDQMLTAVDLLRVMLPLPTSDDQTMPELPIPHGTIRSQALSAPLPLAPIQSRAHARSLALATKSSSLASIASQFASAADRLAATTERSRSDWQTFQSWRDDGEWKLEPRGARPGAGVQSDKAVGNLAKDIAAFYGFDEATPPTRARSWAFLDTKGELLIPRSTAKRRCLRVEIRIGEETHVAHAAVTSEDRLRQAQAEVLDEEVLTTVAAEARSGSLTATIEDNRVEVKSLAGVELVLSIDDAPDDDTSDTHASLALCLLRLRLLALFRHRRSRAKTATPRVLAPVLSLLSHIARFRRVLASLKEMSARFAEAGLPALEIETDYLAETASELISRFATGHDVECGALIDVQILSRRLSIALSTSPTTPVALILPKCRLSLSSLSQLDGFLAIEASAAIAVALGTRLQSVDGWRWAVEGERVLGEHRDGKAITSTVIFTVRETTVSYVLKRLGDSQPITAKISPGANLLERCARVL